MTLRLQVQFLEPAKMWHPNVADDGALCKDVLKQWMTHSHSQVLGNKVLGLIQSLLSILQSPDTSTSLNQQATNEWQKDPINYAEFARTVKSKA